MTDHDPDSDAQLSGLFEARVDTTSCDQKGIRARG